MKPSTLERIFEPFFTTKDAGSGLGLATTLGIIFRHDGGIQVESDLDQGTVFRIAFPIIESPTEDTTQQPDIREEITLPSATILVIDDQIPVLDSVTDILEDSDVKLFIADGGESGLKMFEKHKEEIDLVLLDIQLPDINGLIVLEKIQEISPAIKVILSSGYNPQISTETTFDDTDISFLSKPYRQISLKKAIRDALET